MLLARLQSTQRDHVPAASPPAGSVAVKSVMLAFGTIRACGNVTTAFADAVLAVQFWARSNRIAVINGSGSSVSKLTPVMVTVVLTLPCSNLSGEKDAA